MSCIKQQREIYRGDPKTRCINRDASFFMQIVEDQCAGCPFKQSKAPVIKPCLEISTPKVTKMIPHVDPDYPECEFRTNGPRCGMTGLTVTPEICDRCNKETREQTARLGDKMKHYATAIKNWVANGMPKRSPDEVSKLLEGCKKCNKYENGVCNSCGCQVNNSAPLTNKLAMATEHCPLGQF